MSSKNKYGGWLIVFVFVMIVVLNPNLMSWQVFVLFIVACLLNVAWGKDKDN